MRPPPPYSAEPSAGWTPWSGLAPLVCIVLVALPDAAVSLALAHFHRIDAHDTPVGLLSWCLFLVATFGLMALVFWAWVRFVERRPLATIGLVGAHRVRTFLGGWAVGLVAVGALVAAIAASGGYHPGAIMPALASPRALLGIAALAPCFALQSSVEEMIFRGWLVSGIARRRSVPLAVALSSATFTLLHFERGQHWATTLAIVLFAVFACAWALRTGNVWGVMGWHGAWNWLLAVGFDLPVTGLRTNLPALLVKLTPVGPRLLTGGAQGPEGSLWCSALFLVALAGFAGTALRARRVRSAALLVPPAAQSAAD